MPGTDLSDFNQEIADKFCDAIATGNKGIARLCFENKDFPNSRKIYEWLDSNEAFARQYARAKSEQIHRLGEEILAIADDTQYDELCEQYIPTAERNEEGKVVFIKVKKVNKQFVESKRQMIDARKWLMSKLMPKVYGDKIEVADDKKLEIILKDDDEETNLITT